MNRVVSTIWGSCIVLAVAALPHEALAHDEIFVGHNAAGQLVAHNGQHAPIRMPVTTIPGLTGWSVGGPGIESQGVDEPKEDFFALPDTVEIEIVLSNIDPTLHLFNSNGSGFVLMGTTYVVLVPFFHWHCFWNLSEGTYGTVYAAEFTFFDKSGQFTPSAPVTVEFIPQCPGDVDLSTMVNVADLLAVITAWGSCPNGCESTCPPDFDESCDVGVVDLLVVINNWGQCVP